MRRVLCSQLPTPARREPLAESEANHLIQVLRMRDGECIEALDGAGRSCVARLQIRGDRVELVWDDSVSKTSLRSDSGDAVLPIELEIAILKGDAMEWVVEKAVELGLSKLFPLTTAHTIVQMDRKGPEAFQARWQKIADQALKQCGRLTTMEVALPVALPLHLSARKFSAASPRWVAMESDRDRLPLLTNVYSEASLSAPTGPFRILIGPEGGWSDQEKELLAVSGTPVSLGPLVLRAETAAIASIAAIAMEMRRQR